MQPVSLSQTNQDITNSRTQGAQNQARLDTQAQQYQGNYNADYANAGKAGQALSQFAQNMQNPSDYYNQQLQGAYQQYGINPADLLAANQSLARTQTTMNNLPQAASQIGGGYGTTAGAQALNYGNMAGQLQGVQTGQANAVNAFQNSIQNAMTQANQAGQLFATGQGTKEKALSDAYSGAVNQMQVSEKAMNDIETLQQNQGYATAQQISAYQNAYSNWVTAQANAQTAAANMMTAQSTQQLNAQKILESQTAQKLSDQQYNEQKTKDEEAKNKASAPTNQGGSFWDFFKRFA